MQTDQQPTNKFCVSHSIREVHEYFTCSSFFAAVIENIILCDKRSKCEPIKLATTKTHIPSKSMQNNTVKWIIQHMLCHRWFAEWTEMSQWTAHSFHKTFCYSFSHIFTHIAYTVSRGVYWALPIHTTRNKVCREQENMTKTLNIRSRCNLQQNISPKLCPIHWDISVRSTHKRWHNTHTADASKSK